MIVTAISQPVTLTFRDQFDRNTPTWLNGPIGTRYRYPMGVLLDAMGDSAIDAVQARFPDTAPDDAFVYLSQDRQIDRGFQEPLSSYRVRLRQWYDLWRHAGSAWGVLSALESYITPDSALMRTVSNDSAWDTWTPGTTDATTTPPTHQLERPRNWDWDSSPAFDPLSTEYHAKWYRAWVIIYPPPSLWKKTRKYGDGMRYGDGSCYGYTGTFDQTQSLRALVRKWAPAHCKVQWIILCFDPDPFHPETAVSYPSTGLLPDGRFKNWGYRSGGGDAYVNYRTIIGLGTSFGVNAASYINVDVS